MRFGRWVLGAVVAAVLVGFVAVALFAKADKEQLGKPVHIQHTGQTSSPRPPVSDTASTQASRTPSGNEPSTSAPPASTAPRTVPDRTEAPPVTKPPPTAGDDDDHDDDDYYYDDDDEDDGADD